MYRTVRGVPDTAATASLIGRPSPAARSRLQAPYSGSLSRAAQIASVANSHDPARSETSLGRSRLTAATTIPGISNRTAWPTGTVQGKSLPFRRIHSSFQQSFLKSMRNRSR